jgi:hypothetical protein
MREIMRRFERDYYPPAFLQQHENKMQLLRHERQIEGRRLDGLKKTLETKLSGASRDARRGRAA